MATQVLNPFDSAADPQVKSGVFDYFGMVVIDAWFCVLVKGTGKIPFNPAQHSEDKRCTAVDMEVIPLAEQNISWPVKRNMLAESTEWAGTVLPSIRNTGLSLLELTNKWVQITMVETGRTYQGKDGETKKNTTFKIVQVFANEQECRAAYNAFAAGAPAATPASAQQAAPDQPANGGNKEKETAAKFLKVIVENAARGEKDPAVITSKVATAIANMPPVAKWFTGDSPETMTLIMEAMSK